MKRVNVVIVIDPTGEQVLMCQRRKEPYRGKLNLVGGKAETGEEDVRAAYRELAEETGITDGDIHLRHVMDIRYAVSDLELQTYAGRLRHPVDVVGEENPLHWISLSENFFDMERFAGEGNIGHMLATIREHLPEILMKRLPMTHEMSLRSGPFQKIASGLKRYELRLNDEKRQLLRVGDRILFTNTKDGLTLRVRVTSLHPFPDFAALYAALPLLECGYTKETLAKASPEDMDVYYPKEKQARYGVLGIGIEIERFPVENLPGPYVPRLLTPQDVPEMLRLARTNPLYYSYTQTEPTEENLAHDLQALPPRRHLADKHFFGWFDGGRLVAMMDLIARHPREDAAFIGWFILDGAEQGKGLGRRLMMDVERMLVNAGVAEVRLGRIEGNPQSERFWHRCGYAENGRSYVTDGYTVVIMTKKLA